MTTTPQHGQYSKIPCPNCKHVHYLFYWAGVDQYLYLKCTIHGLIRRSEYKVQAQGGGH